MLQLFLASDEKIAGTEREILAKIDLLDAWLLLSDSLDSICCQGDAPC